MKNELIAPRNLSHPFKTIFRLCFLLRFLYKNLNGRFRGGRVTWRNKSKISFNFPFWIKDVETYFGIFYSFCLGYMYVLCFTFIPFKFALNGVFDQTNFVLLVSSLKNTSIKKHKHYLMYFCLKFLSNTWFRSTGTRD